LSSIPHWVNSASNACNTDNAVTTKLRVYNQPKSVKRGETYLAGGESPRFTEHLLEEGRLDLEVLGDDIETEEMAINALARHRRAVAVLVDLCRLVQELDTFLVLKHCEHCRIVNIVAL